MISSQLLDSFFEGECPLIGHVSEINYNYAHVLTHDHSSENVQHIPEHSLLLIKIERAINNTSESYIDSIILCRVNILSYTDTFSKENKQASIKKFNRKLSSLLEQRNGNDSLTQNMLSYHQLDCQILGTFYIDSNKDITFGTDSFNFSVAITYSVYKPMGKALSKIVNFINSTQLKNNISLLNNLKSKSNSENIKSTYNQQELSFNIGHVRYASTDTEVHLKDTHVNVMTTDFLNQKTALFGMTRTGKSNTVKVIIEGIQELSRKHNINIGQLIYDINGEYANDNTQNKKIENSILYSIDKEILKQSKDFNGALNNFYLNPEYALKVIKAELSSSDKQSNYLNLFLSITAQDIFNSLFTYFLWCLLLYKSGFEINNGENKQSNSFIILEKGEISICDSTKNDVQKLPTELFQNDNNIKNKEFLKHIKIKNSSSGTVYSFNNKALEEVIRYICYDGLNLKPNDKQRSLIEFISQYANRKPISGWQMLLPVTKYHYIIEKGYHRNEPLNYQEVIYKFLKNGKTVILDLSTGDPDIRKFISDELMDYIFQKQIQTFREGKFCPAINVFIEEAHNLIGKNASIDSLWPRIAKEGAKYHIGLLYATQEPSAIHTSILANTANFVIAHLNNNFEIKTISEYEDFEDFSTSIKKSHDVGFIRLKLLSKPFTISVQVNKYQ